MKEKIRVINLIYSYAIEGPGGGIGRFVMDLCPLMDTNQFALTTFALHPYHTFSEQENINRLKMMGINAIINPTWDESDPYSSFFQAQRYLNNLLKRNKVDIIHSHSEFTDIVALLSKLALKAPIIMRTVHYGFRYEWRKKPLRRLLLTNISYPLLFDKEICVSPSITQSLNQRPLARLLKRKTLFIPNGINTKRFVGYEKDHEKLCREFMLPKDVQIICSIGRLTEQKGFSYLIEASKIVIQSNPKTIFLLVGEGELENELRTKIQQLDLEKHFLLIGSHSNIEDILVNCDLFVSSSLWEGLPTVVLESMAARIPVVGTDIPGTNDLIQHDINGWLAPAKNSVALAEMIIFASKNRNRWPEIIQNAIETTNKFSLFNIAKDYEKIYQSQYQRKNK